MGKNKQALIKLLLIMAILFTPLAPVSAARPQRMETVSDLWLDVSLGPPLVDWFNQVARPDDIARVDHVERIDLLDRITVGRKLVVFKSAAEAERLMPAIADRVDIVGYNLEHGPGNPVDEQADPVGNARRMRAVADEYGMALAFGPDHQFALSDGVAIAPYVDIFVLQVQRAQTEPDLVLDFVLPLIPKLRQANPNLQISVQVRTEGDVVAIANLIDSIKGELNGVSILTSPETVDIAAALVAELQIRDSGLSDRSRRLTASNGEAAPTNTSRLPLIPSLIQTGGPLAVQDTGLFWILTMVGAMVAGAIGGGIVAALVCGGKK